MVGTVTQRTREVRYTLYRINSTVEGGQSFNTAFGLYRTFILIADRTDICISRSFRMTTDRGQQPRAGQTDCCIYIISYSLIQCQGLNWDIAERSQHQNLLTSLLLCRLENFFMHGARVAWALHFNHAVRCTRSDVSNVR